MSIPPLKYITGADVFGCTLKDKLLTHLRNHNYQVEDLGVGPYYSIGAQIGERVASGDSNTRGLVACGTGIGVAIFANKFPGVYAALCRNVDDAKNTRAINNANVLAVAGEGTDPETAIEILETFIRTEFKSPCPANGNKEWPEETARFLDESLGEMNKIGTITTTATTLNTNDLSNPVDVPGSSCALCCLAKDREFVPVDIMPGGMMKIVRESPTSAIVKFKAGSIEPAHHHTFGHDLFVTKGKKTVWNLSKKEKYDLGGGDYLFTPAGDVHRVKYEEDTEFFLKWEGPWDIVLDEDLETAKAAIEREC